MSANPAVSTSILCKV